MRCVIHSRTFLSSGSVSKQHFCFKLRFILYIFFICAVDGSTVVLYVHLIRKCICLVIYHLRLIIIRVLLLLLFIISFTFVVCALNLQKDIGIIIIIID